MDEKVAKIRNMNDALRRFQLSGKIVFSGDLAYESPETHGSVANAVAEFNAWPEGNDPYGEHDFGTFKHQVDGVEQEIAFKIDYYNRAMDAGSEDPSDPAQTTRVLTIFYLRDY